MIVEDEAIIAMSLEDELREHRFQILGPFSRSAEAWAALETTTPDLAILDAVLADDTCVAVARELQRRGVPFVIYSGLQRFEEHAPELTGALWIEKPVAVNVVVRAALALAPKRPVFSVP